MKLNPFRREPDMQNNDGLLKAIVAAASQGTHASTQAMYAAILKSTLLLAADPKASPRPILFVNKDGQTVLPVFTDVERLRKLCPDALKVSAMPTRDICGLALKNKIHIVNINPQNGPGVNLLPDEVEAISQGRIPTITSTSPQPLADPTLVPFGSPKLPPQELIDEMLDTASALLSKESVVDEAYIMLLASDDSTSQLAIGLCFRAKTSNDARSAVSQRLIPALEGVVKRPVKSVWLTDNDLKGIRAVQDPFYRSG